jgi:3-hydroxyisobutyrate dehydrogenase-like beta-hydroxyacid dehydrogenase
MKIGFIGLGVMGAPMARNLAAAGHEIVTVLNRSPLPADLKAATAQELMNACKAQDGGADADHSFLVRALEILSSHELSGG